MRKIISEADKERKKRRNAQIMSLIMLTIMILSSVGFAFSYYSTSGNNSTDDSNLEYGVIKYGDNTIYLRLPQSSIKNVSITSLKTINDYYMQNVYVSSDSDEAFQEIYSSIGQYSERIQEACYGNCTEDLPEKDCSDNLIVFREREENKVYEDGNCVFIEGDLGAVDAFIYKLFGKI